MLNDSEFFINFLLLVPIIQISMKNWGFSLIAAKPAGFAADVRDQPGLPVPEANLIWDFRMYVCISRVSFKTRGRRRGRRRGRGLGRGLSLFLKKAVLGWGLGLFRVRVRVKKKKDRLRPWRRPRVLLTPVYHRFQVCSSRSRLFCLQLIGFRKKT